MTADARVAAVQALGFTVRQATFLTHVARHSGYFLRRQYTTFAGTAKGKNVQRFCVAVVARGVAVRATYRADRGHIYHLRDGRVYGAVGAPHDRNQRPVSPARIAQKLMLLDIVLGHPTGVWYATEAEKVALCTEQLGIASVDLPRHTWAVDAARARTTRYFVDKLPIALMGEPPQLHLVYLSVDGSPVPFARWLTTHARLLSAVPAWTVLAAHPVEVGTAALRDVFHRATGTLGEWSEGQRRDLERYFDARRAVEQTAHGTLAVAELQAFRAARLAYAEPQLEALFSRWLAGGARRLELAHLGAPLAACGRLVCYPLPHRYDQFGAYAGVV